MQCMGFNRALPLGRQQVGWGWQRVFTPLSFTCTEIGEVLLSFGLPRVHSQANLWLQVPPAVAAAFSGVHSSTPCGRLFSSDVASTGTQLPCEDSLPVHFMERTTEFI